MAYNLERRNGELGSGIASAIIGLALAVAPWALGFVGTAAAAWNAWLVGIAAIVVALFAIYRWMTWEPWAYMVLGIWTVLAPWLLGFASLTPALYAHLGAGIVLVVVAAYELWQSGNRPASTA